MKTLLPVAMILCGLSTAVNSVFAQTWTPTGAPTNNWYSVSASADGSKLAALSQSGEIGAIWVSTNSGTTWTSNNIAGVTDEGLVRPIAMSANGDKMAAVATYGSEIYTSTNFGVTWASNSVPAEPWWSIASSADGAKLVALGGGGIGPGPIYVSADSGMTWTPANAPVTNWVSVAASANGSNWVAAVELSYGQSPSGYIYTSTDCGLDWTLMTNAPNLQYLSISSSADGATLLAVGGGGPSLIYTSTNSGTTWISNTTPLGLFSDGACSADGRTLAVVSPLGLYGGNTGFIYTSTNSGMTWISNSVPNQSWSRIASSADGNLLVASGTTSFFSGSGSIYILQNISSPELNIFQVNSNLALSWLIPSTNFVVQQSPDLISWSSVTDAPALNLTNLNNELSLSPTNSSGFFRLMSQ